MAKADARFKKMKDWLKKHPVIATGFVADNIGIERSNFSAALSGTRPLPAKYLDPLEKELENYGYKK